MKTCLECGQPFGRTTGEPPSKFARRRFCGRSCSSTYQHRCLRKRNEAQVEQSAQHIADRIEDVEWIIDTDTPKRVATRLGYASVDNLQRVLIRWGRHDLARRLHESAVA